MACHRTSAVLQPHVRTVAGHPPWARGRQPTTPPSTELILRTRARFRRRTPHVRQDQRGGGCRSREVGGDAGQRVGRWWCTPGTPDGAHHSTSAATHCAASTLTSQ
jgi:hypothetical protein